MSAVGAPPPVGIGPSEVSGALGGLRSLGELGSAGAEKVGAGNSIPFSSVLGDMLAAANGAELRADAASAAFAAGKSDDIHGTMIAVKEADISMRLTATVRNKLLDAFYELWRMSV